MSQIENSRRIIFLVSLFSGAIMLASAVIQAGEMLSSVGVSGVASALKLASKDSVNLALYLTFQGAFVAIVLWSGFSMLKGHRRRGELVASLAVVLGVVALALPTSLGYPTSIVGSGAALLAMILVGAAGLLSLRLPQVEVERKMLLTPVEISLVAVFSALTAILTGSTGVMLPTPTGGYTHIGDTMIYVSALLFGSKVGGLVGIIGPVAADLFVGYPRWFVTVLAHGAQGFIAGLGRKRAIVIQLVLMVVSGLVMATVYFFVNIFIKGYPVAVISYARDIFGQTLVSIILGVVLTKATERVLPSLLR